MLPDDARLCLSCAGAPQGGTVDTTDAAVVTHADYSVDAAEVYAGPARSTGEIAAARVLHTREYDAQGAIDRRGEEAYDDGWMDPGMARRR